MEAKHTPGPWRYQRENGSPTTGQHMIAGDTPPGYLAEVRDCGSGDVSANARLIAAAPELLEACQAMIEWDDREQDHAVDFSARAELCRVAFDKARAAIAKAIDYAARGLPALADGCLRSPPLPNRSPHLETNMLNNLNPTIARALAPFAPPHSAVHQAIREEDWIAADRALNVNKAERRAQLDADWALAEQQRHLDHGWTA